MEDIIKELFRVTDENIVYQNVVINLPNFVLDNNSDRNTTHQLGDYYKDVKTSLRLIRNAISKNGACIVVVEDIPRPVITSLRASDSKIADIKPLMLNLDRDAIIKSAERYVRDMLNMSLTDTDIRIAPSDQIRVIHGNGANLIVPLENFVPSTCVYVTGRYPNFKVLGYADYDMLVNFKDDDYYKVPATDLKPIEDLILDAQFVTPFSAKPFEMIGMNWKVGIMLQQTSFYYKETINLPNNQYVIITTKSYDTDVSNIELNDTLFINTDRETFLSYTKT